MWASICIYTYRYLLPFNPAEMPIEQMVFYATSIALIAGTIVMWLIAGRVVHPLAYRLRVSKILRRSASAKVRSVPPTVLASARAGGAAHDARILVASHDANGSISDIEWAHAAAAPRVGQRRCAAAHGMPFVRRGATPDTALPHFCRQPGNLCGRGETCAESSEQAA